MLKRCIETYLDREIYDIDECTNMDAEDIISKNPKEETWRNTRGIRNKNYYNTKTGKYEFNLNRKKLYYLANSFNLDYHPRVLVFVEGKTEEKIIRKIFEYYFTDLENTRIDLINIGGISKFFSREISEKDENKKYQKVIISNYSQLINYLYENYQVIPFFIGDNENQILNILKKGVIFDSDQMLFDKTQLTAREYAETLNYISNEYLKK